MSSFCFFMPKKSKLPLCVYSGHHCILYRLFALVRTLAGLGLVRQQLYNHCQYKVHVHTQSAAQRHLSPLNQHFMEGARGQSYNQSLFDSSQILFFPLRGWVVGSGPLMENSLFLIQSLNIIQRSGGLRFCRLFARTNDDFSDQMLKIKNFLFQIKHCIK